MSEDGKKVKGTIWLWTGIGLVAGIWIGGFAGGLTGLGWIPAFIVGPLIGFLAYRSSKKNGGGAPGWLWRSKKAE